MESDEGGQRVCRLMSTAAATGGAPMRQEGQRFFFFIIIFLVCFFLVIIFLFCVFFVFFGQKEGQGHLFSRDFLLILNGFSVLSELTCLQSQH